jgi:hypothetical protein
MPGNPREMITMAERRFPVRVRIAVPSGGFGQRYTDMTAWLDASCGADGWAITPSGMRGVLNDAVSIFSLMPRLRAASSHDGAPAPGSRRPGVCSRSRCARMSQYRG